MTTLLQVGLSNLLVASLLAVAATTVARLARRPALTHALWLLVLVKLITPPLVLVPMPWPDLASDPVERNAAVAPAAVRLPAPAEIQPPDAEGVAVQGFLPPARNAALIDGADPVAWGKHDDLGNGIAVPEALQTPPTAAAPAVDSPFPVWAVIALLWLTGSLAWFGLAGRRVMQFERLLRHGRRAPAHVQVETELLARRLAIRCPEVWLVPGTLSPMVWVLGRARRLLVPEWLLQRLSAEQRRAMLVHELAHLRRRDHWVRALELVVLGLYWWCPLVWWAQRELREAEEECCDAWVLWALPGSARAYAHALVDTVDFLSEVKPALSPVASGFGPVHLLRRRLTMIMRGQTPRALTWLGVLGVIALAAMLLPLVPSWAQPGPGQGARPGGDPRREEILNLKQKLHLRKLAEEIERARAELDRKTKELHEEMARLRQGEAGDKGGRGGVGGVPDSQGVGGPRAGGAMGGGFGKFAPPDLDRRLKDVENKLDLVLREVLELRRQLGERKPMPGPGLPGPGIGPGFPGAPGGGAFPGGPDGGVSPPGSYQPPPLPPATRGGLELHPIPRDPNRREP